MRNAYISALHEIARNDDRVLALVADNGAIVYDNYRRDFGDRFINFGISEANMVSVAAGLASCGRIPFAYTIAGFLTMRAFEQIRNDVCLQKMNVKLVGIGVGFVYSDLGPTHHTVEDIGLMRSLPGMTIFSPADPVEARECTFAAAQIDGPVYIRLATGGSQKIYDENYTFEFGKAVTLNQGTDLAVITTGNILGEVIEAVDRLNSRGVSAGLINVHTLKPFDKQTVIAAAVETGRILTVEEHSIHAGLGGIVSEVLAESGVSAKCRRLGLDNTFPVGYGSYKQMKEYNGLSAEHIINAAMQLMEGDDG